MSTQQQREDGVPFTISSAQQSFRLLELPPELLDLATTGGASSWSLKSADASIPSAGNKHPSESHAVLCTANKTYQLRQVQTSNSVLIAKPVSVQRSPNDIPVSAISSIASCNTSLETVPDTGSPSPFLLPLLLVYHGPSDLARDSVKGSRKSELFSNVPYSDGECEASWRELAAFETKGKSWRPSAAACLQAWQSLMSAAIAEGIDVSTQFLKRDLVKADMDDEYPIGLLDAVLFKGSAQANVEDEWLSLERPTCVASVGKMVLEALADEGKEVQLTKFMETWKDGLPEAWRDAAKLEVIKGFYEQPKSSTISLKGHSAATAAAPANSKSRKWHEKFKASRQ